MTDRIEGPSEELTISSSSNALSIKWKKPNGGLFQGEEGYMLEAITEYCRDSESSSQILRNLNNAINREKKASASTSRSAIIKECLISLMKEREDVLWYTKRLELLENFEPELKLQPDTGKRDQVRDAIIDGMKEEIDKNDS